MTVQVRPAASRAVTRTDWLDSRHSFSYGRHYDPANTSHGLLLVCNEDRLAPGSGFGPHRHADVEVVTWVLSGALRHEDSSGATGVVVPGQVQVMSAGAGVEHAERAEGGTGVHLVQAWVQPRAPGGPSAYAQADVAEALAGGGLVPVASGLPGAEAPVPLRADAALHVARLGPGGSVLLPEAPSLHVLLARGRAELEQAGALAAGDAVRLTATGGQRLTATGDAEVLVWETWPGPR